MDFDEECPQCSQREPQIVTEARSSGYSECVSGFESLSWSTRGLTVQELLASVILEIYT
jgi:hypothetical protein